MLIKAKEELKDGWSELVKESSYPSLGASLSLLRLKEGESVEVTTGGEEHMFDLFKGNVSYEIGGDAYLDERIDPFVQSCSVMHVPCGETIMIHADEDSEIIVPHTENGSHFKPSFYSVPDSFVGKGFLEDRCLRAKRPFENRTKCKGTNIFSGELVVHQGSWACYPPHRHDEPEIYFYRFDGDYGYAFVEDGDVVHRVSENDIVGITDRRNHSQAVAPGFRAFIFWLQRLKDDGSDIVYELDGRYAHFES